jgi:hypothetical protein
MRPLRTITPAVTCSVQSTFTTGLLPADHGCVANGWYFRDLPRSALWRQSNQLVAGEKIWDAAKRATRLHLRQAVLVVQHVLDGRLGGDAAAAVPGRRAQDPDFYTQPAELHGELLASWALPAVQLLGPRPASRRREWIGALRGDVFERSSRR